MAQGDATPPLEVAAEVRSALLDRRGVVALESALLTHGLPADAAQRALELQRRACADAGALAAVVGVAGGRLCAGLSQADCEALACRADAGKA
jgi:pseudouridine-5'-phosphate glycosidase